MCSTINFTDATSELRIRLVAKQLPFHRYKRLCEWLNCFQYINPDDRKIAKELLVLPELSVHRATELFAYSIWLDCVESTLTLEEQLCLARLIHESET